MPPRPLKTDETLACSAILSDVTTPANRSKALAHVGIAFAICFCIGPPDWRLLRVAIPHHLTHLWSGIERIRYSSYNNPRPSFGRDYFPYCRSARNAWKGPHPNRGGEGKSKSIREPNIKWQDQRHISAIEEGQRRKADRVVEVASSLPLPVSGHLQWS